MQMPTLLFEGQWKDKEGKAHKIQLTTCPRCKEIVSEIHYICCGSLMSGWRCIHARKRGGTKTCLTTKQLDISAGELKAAKDAERKPATLSGSRQHS